MSDPRLAQYLDFLRFPSISTDPQRKGDVAACAAWLEQKLTGMGLDTQAVPTNGHPILHAKNNHTPGRRTVIISGHYDVQPVDPVNLWTSPPFEPRIQDDIVFA